MTGAHPLRGLTCAVIGGGGFLGANLCPKLLALGAIVRVYGRTRYYDAPFQGVTWLAGALSDTDKLASALEGADVVFHLAGTSSPASAEASRSRALATSIGGTLELLYICRQSCIPSVIFASQLGSAPSWERLW